MRKGKHYIENLEEKINRELGEFAKERLIVECYEKYQKKQKKRR